MGLDRSLDSKKGAEVTNRSDVPKVLSEVLTNNKLDSVKCRRLYRKGLYCKQTTIHFLIKAVIRHE
jgi:hypothetical protein